jgi:hypothetical protein
MQFFLAIPTAAVAESTNSFYGVPPRCEARCVVWIAHDGK